MQYWYTRNVPVFTNTGTFQYLGPEVYFFRSYISKHTIPKIQNCVFLMNFRTLSEELCFLLIFHVLLFSYNFPQSFVTSVAIYGHRIHRFRHRIFRSDQD